MRRILLLLVSLAFLSALLFACNGFNNNKCATCEPVKPAYSVRLAFGAKSYPFSVYLGKAEGDTTRTNGLFICDDNSLSPEELAILLPSVKPSMQAHKNDAQLINLVLYTTTIYDTSATIKGEDVFGILAYYRTEEAVFVYPYKVENEKLELLNERAGKIRFISTNDYYSAISLFSPSRKSEVSIISLLNNQRIPKSKGGRLEF